MTMIDSGTVWLKIVEIPMFDLDEVTAGNDEYIDKSSARVSQFFLTYGYSDTCVQSKSCLTTDLSLNEA